MRHAYGTLEIIDYSHDRESGTYLDVIRSREYEALIGTMIENVQCRNSAIDTAPFIRELGNLT
jgi:hypothetical protein